MLLRAGRRLERGVRDLQFRQARAARQLFDGAAVEIARGKIHAREIAARLQHVIDQTDALEQLRPIQARRRAHAGDDVAHRHARRALALVLAVHEFVGRDALRRKLAFQPYDSRRDPRVLVPQPLDKLDREGLRQRRLFVAPQNDPGRFGHVPVHAQQAVGLGIRFLAGSPAADDAIGRAPQVFDQHDAQRDGNRPQLADAERLNALIGAHEAAQHVGVEAAVGMGNERPGDPEDARVAGEGAARQLRQLAIIARRQIIANLADLLFDKMIIVEQPFGGGRRGLPVAGRSCDFVIGRKQDRFVVLQPRSQRAARNWRGGDLLGGG
jgi:hypothetical protein